MVAVSKTLVLFLLDSACFGRTMNALDAHRQGDQHKHKHRQKHGHKHGHGEPDEESGSGPIVNLSPEQRQQKHQEEFEKEFEVKIGMLHAHNTGLRLGVVLDSLNDWEPPEVISFRKPSLIEEWNKANPDKAVHLHDRIVRVNNILFHHNAETFIERIVGQFQAGRKLKDGAKDMLVLQVQRPRTSEIDTTRFDFQRSDLHNKLYAKEFFVELPVPENETSPTTIDRVLGWDLNLTTDWEPVSIGKIANGSVLAKWNEAHPSDMVLQGDEILHVNKRHWLHNTSQFLPHLTFNYQHRYDRYNGTFALGLRRPRRVQEAYDQAKELEEQKSKQAREREELRKQMFGKEYVVSLSVPENETSSASMGSVLGWKLNVTKDWEPVSIGKIVEGGLLAQWNEANPGDRILEGDEILHVNKRHWLHNTTLFLSHMSFNYEHRAELAANKTFTLGLRRPRRVQDAYDQALLAAQRAKEQAKADEEMHRVARKIVDAVRMWNNDFPRFRIDTSSKTGQNSTSRASAPTNSATAAEPSSPPSNSGGEQDDSDDVIGATEEEDDSATSGPAPKDSAAAAKPSSPASSSGVEQDDSDDVIGATEEEDDSATSGPAPKDSAAAAKPSSPASSSGVEQDDSDDVIGATEEEEVRGSFLQNAEPAGSESVSGMATPDEEP